MAGSLAPVMYWAARTTLYSALRSEAEQLQYQAVMQPVKMLLLHYSPIDESGGMLGPPFPVVHNHLLRSGSHTIFIVFWPLNPIGVTYLEQTPSQD